MLNLIDTRILGIELPSAIVAAIDRKIEQYYISEEYKFRVAREIRESERKKIEAEGISEFQRIVSQGISESYLRWRGIEATLQLAQSSNSKIVIVGSGKDGLPIILGNVDAEEPASAMLHLMNGIGQVWGSVRDPIPGARDDNGQLDRHDHIDRHDDYRPRNHLNQSVIAMTAMRFSSSLGCNISLAAGGRLPELEFFVDRPCRFAVGHGRGKRRGNGRNAPAAGAAPGKATMVQACRSSPAETVRAFELRCRRSCLPQDTCVAVRSPDASLRSSRAAA